jgi:hypothetical protein
MCQRHDPQCGDMRGSGTFKKQNLMGDHWGHGPQKELMFSWDTG